MTRLQFAAIQGGPILFVHLASSKLGSATIAQCRKAKKAASTNAWLRVHIIRAASLPDREFVRSDLKSGSKSRDGKNLRYRNPWHKNATAPASATRANFCPGGDQKRIHSQISGTRVP